jgi:hypothetical protein
MLAHGTFFVLCFNVFVSNKKIQNVEKDFSSPPKFYLVLPHE